MRNALRLGSFVAVLCLLVSVAGTRADSLQVQLGYVDQLRTGEPPLSTPWCGGALTHFDGSSPNDGCSQSFDAGAILASSIWGRRPLQSAMWLSV